MMARRPSKHLRPARPLSSGHATSVIKSDGRWIVRSVSGAAATKAYRCPGCNVEIRPDAARGGLARHTWPALRVPGRRAPTLAQAAGNGDGEHEPPQHGLFSTQLGATGPRRVSPRLFGQGKNWNTIAKALSDSARSRSLTCPITANPPGQITFSPKMAGQVAELPWPRGREIRTLWSATRWAARWL